MEQEVEKLKKQMDGNFDEKSPSPAKKTKTPDA
jgi:hypothetical protein